MLNKTITEFYFCKRDGYTARCKMCLNILNKQKAKLHPEWKYEYITK